MSAKTTKTTDKSAPQTTGKGKKMCTGCNSIISARFKACPECGMEFTPKTKKEPKNTPGDTQINPVALMKVLNERGYKVQRLIDEFTGEMVSQKVDPVIESLLKMIVFREIPGSRAEDGSIYCNQTSPQIQFSMTLDTLLTALKIPARKK